MSTNHNRIRVADLENNEPNKILTTNEKGELEFSNVNNLKTDGYNGLDYTSEGKVLDARQGKVLKNLIDNINVSPTPLVNDLTTGGTSKALTAEMGKTLENTKLSATLATDAETQINATVPEDNKVISRSTLYNWWKWIENTVLHKSGNESFTGRKSSVNTGATSINGLSLTNTGTGTSNALEVVTPVGASGEGQRINHSGTGTGLSIINFGVGIAQNIENRASGSLALYVNNVSTTGIGQRVRNQTGIGFDLQNDGTGLGLNLNSATASTGDLIQFTKNNVVTSRFDHNGILTSPALILSGETASTLASFDASKNVKSLPLVTYPSLTEVSYVKGVTSSIQTQINEKQVKDSQLEISASTNVSNTWEGQTVLFTANCTITVPSALANSLMFSFYTLAGVTVNWTITSPFVWDITPTTITERITGVFMRRGATNTIILQY